jgi:hypothetical protein
MTFLLAQFGVQQEYGLAGTVLVVAAGLLPDLDGIGVIFGWRFYQRYHRKLGHGLPVTLIGPPLLALAGVGLFNADFFVLWLWCQVALLGHLFTDVLFYRWPVQLFWPVSTWGWDAGLVGWNDLVPTLLLYGASVVALLWPGLAPPAAGFGLAGVLLYLVWRAIRPASNGDWLSGGWANQRHPLWRWLTGDFIHG